MAVITNLRSSQTGSSPDMMFNTSAGSRPGEDNSKHIAIAVLAIGGLVLVAGLINVKVGRLTAGVSS